MSDWVETISASNSFHMRNGVLTVKESGLYFIYAQVGLKDDFRNIVFFKSYEFFSKTVFHSHLRVLSYEMEM